MNTITSTVSVDIRLIGTTYVVLVNNIQILSTTDKLAAAGFANVTFAGLNAARVNARWTDGAIAILYGDNA